MPKALNNKAQGRPELGAHPGITIQKIQSYPNGVPQMPQSLVQIYVHLVFSTKDRAPFLRDLTLRQRTHAYATCGIERSAASPRILKAFNTKAQGRPELCRGAHPGFR
jgi:hypothetical protein